LSTFYFYKAEVLANLDENGAGFSSKDMFQGQKADIEFVQVGQL
jgi:hypothetical protein